MTTFLAILTGGGLAALGGLLSGWLTERLGAKRDHRRYEHERAMADQAQVQERAMAREARRQERVENTYAEMLRLMAHVHAWAARVSPLWGPTPELDSFPEEEESRIAVLVTMHGSDEIGRLLEDEWAPQVQEIIDANDMVREGDEHAQEERERLPQYQEAMSTAAEAIRRQIRRELAGEV